MIKGIGLNLYVFRVQKLYTEETLFENKDSLNYVMVIINGKYLNIKLRMVVVSNEG